MIWVATPPSSFPGEISHINSLLCAGGPDVLLLRKPGFSALEYARLLEGIDPVFYSRIMIAGQPALVKEYGLRGLHMSEAFRASADVKSFGGCKLSASIHEGFENGVVAEGKLVDIHCADTAIVEVHSGDTAIVEIHSADTAIVEVHSADTAIVEVHSADTAIVEVHSADAAIDHLILGPVFDSISKPGHTGRLAEMKNIPSNALAIGGITERNIGLLRPIGFCGAVLLGAIWNDPFNAVHTYQSIKAAWNRT